MSLGVKCAVLTFCQPLSVYPSEADIVPLLPYVCFAPKGAVRENGLISVFSPRYCCASKRRRRLAALGCLAAHSRLCSPSIITQYVRLGASLPSSELNVHVALSRMIAPTES